MKHSYLLVPLCAFALGCSSSTDDTGETSDEPAPDAEFDPSKANQAFINLAPPDNGYQIETIGGWIEPGEDTEYCEIAQIPGEPGTELYTSRMEIVGTGESHHLIISTVEVGSQTEAEVAVGDRQRCSGSAHSVYNDIAGLTAGGARYQDAEYPEGIGKVVHTGQYIVFDYHHLNTTLEPVWAKHKLNIHLTDSIERTVELFGFYNLAIEVPPQSAASFEMTEEFKTDVLVTSLSRHTHQWGTDFNVWFSGGPRDGELIWTSTDWAEDINFSFDEPVFMEAGTGFRYECQFENDTDMELRFGETASEDEMCILFGSWWVPNVGDEVVVQNKYLFDGEGQ